MSNLNRLQKPKYWYVENMDLSLSTSLYLDSDFFPKVKEKPKKDCFCVSAKTKSGKIPNCDCPNP